MKKVMIILVSISLIAAMTACFGNSSPPVTAEHPGPEPIPGHPPAIAVHPGPEPIHRGEQFENSDGNLRITVSSTHTADMPRDIIEVWVSVTNISGQAVAYLHGSGSNLVPEALVADLGGLESTYRAAFMTMDYLTSLLRPDETLVYTLTYAPFHRLSEEEFPMPSPAGSGMDYFENNSDFIPVMTGPVEGYANFTYHLLAEGHSEDDVLYHIENGEARTISVEYAIEVGA
jgi:hypothetical protein